MNEIPFVALINFLYFFDFIGIKLSLKNESKIEFWDWDWVWSDQGASLGETFIFTTVYLTL